MKFTLRGYSSHSNRGGTFFTMVIFIMMLVSTGLMYYYFQRTRSLERKLAALQSGEPRGADDGMFSFLPWNTGRKAIRQEPAPTPAPAAAVMTPQIDQVSPPETVTYHAEVNLPPSGAASTPRPIAAPGESAADEADESTYGSLKLDSESTGDSDILPSEEAPAGYGAGNESSPEAAEDAADDIVEVEPGEEVNSMYDAPPQVRVRAPRRD